MKCTYWPHRTGWIVFKFYSEEDRLEVLNGGPYFAYGRSLLLKIMPRYFRFGGEDIATVPVWIQLPDLPLDCWNERALSKIVSRVGKPISTDKMTRTKERLSFARVMVEVDASKELVTGVDMRLPTGEVYRQVVVFEYYPKYCKKCKIFGHVEGDCKKESEGKTFTAYVPNRKSKSVGVKGSAGMQAGNSKGMEVLPVMTGEFSGQAGPSDRGTVSSKGTAPSDAAQVRACAADSATPRTAPSCAKEGAAMPIQEATQDAKKGKEVAAVSPVPGLPKKAVYLPAQIKGVGGSGIKGQQKRSAGQQDVAAVQQKTVLVAPGLQPVVEGLHRQKSHLRASGGKGKDGKEGCKIGAGSGVGGTLMSSIGDSVVQGLEAADAGCGSCDCADDCETGEGIARPLDRPASFSAMSKGKKKGKAPQSSK